MFREKAWVHHFFFQSGVKSKRACLEEKHWLQASFTPLKKWPCIIFYSWGRGLARINNKVNCEKVGGQSSSVIVLPHSKKKILDYFLSYKCPNCVPQTQTIHCDAKLWFSHTINIRITSSMNCSFPSMQVLTNFFSSSILSMPIIFRDCNSLNSSVGCVILSNRPFEICPTYRNFNFLKSLSDIFSAKYKRRSLKFVERSSAAIICRLQHGSVKRKTFFFLLTWTKLFVNFRI